MLPQNISAYCLIASNKTALTTAENSELRDQEGGLETEVWLNVIIT